MIRKAWVEHPTFKHILVSPLGYVYNSKTRNFIGSENVDNHYIQGTIAPNKVVLFHRLVYSTYYPNVNITGLQIHHKDDDRSNNMISNLEPVTAPQNTQYSIKNRKTTKTPLTIDEHKTIMDIFKSGCTQGKTRREAVKVIGRHFEPSQIHRIVTGKTHKDWYQLHK
ncbi:HNH endonuclease [Kluyvera cryocrescens]|uniref:HNH endonuclease n=1 Tax=Kluyvera cryocrescens TaxID=580 RepID=UPI00248B369A|nr:HNH endonuclease [Kluyvera cryocrescens]